MLIARLLSFGGFGDYYNFRYQLLEYYCIFAVPGENFNEDKISDVYKLIITITIKNYKKRVKKSTFVLFFDENDVLKGKIPKEKSKMKKL